MAASPALLRAGRDAMRTAAGTLVATEETPPHPDYSGKAQLESAIVAF
ncbi:protein of unknown function [Methylocella tundrae]|uniref:Uncharacterized protein n=1 Tax=Methylocella tundrae TaxID=227605 RepID=A0A4U8Z687_METTU|nr:protein of unknown function [Methylocella tundrae]